MITVTEWRWDRGRTERREASRRNLMKEYLLPRAIVPIGVKMMEILVQPGDKLTSRSVIIGLYINVSQLHLIQPKKTYQ